VPCANYPAWLLYQNTYRVHFAKTVAGCAWTMTIPQRLDIARTACKLRMPLRIRCMFRNEDSTPTTT
jgi:hypothetical protein